MFNALRTTAAAAAAALLPALLPVAAQAGEITLYFDLPTAVGSPTRKLDTRLTDGAAIDDRLSADAGLTFSNATSVFVPDATSRGMTGLPLGLGNGFVQSNAKATGPGYSMAIEVDYTRFAFDTLMFRHIAGADLTVQVFTVDGGSFSPAVNERLGTFSSVNTYPGNGSNIRSILFSTDNNTGQDQFFIDNLRLFCDPGTSATNCAVTPAAQVPEPGAAALALLGLAGLAAARRRRA